MQAMLTRSTLAQIAEGEGPWVTILAPLSGGGPLAKGDPIRYRNLVREAADQLEAHLDADARPILEGLGAIAEDRSVFNAGAPGMVVFANAEGTQLWLLPEQVEAGAFVDDRPHLGPLLPIVSDAIHFYVVVLGLHGARLFSCDRWEARPLPLPDDAPTRLEDVVGWELEEQHLDFHAMRRAPMAGRTSAGNKPIYHAQGGGDDDHEAEVEKYLRAIDDALSRRIAHPESPVVLACDPQVEGVFRRVSGMRDLVSPAIHGSFEDAEPAELHRRGLEVVGPRFAGRLGEVIQRWHDLRGTGRTVDRVEDIVPFAARGRVECLLVRQGASVQGAFDPERWRVRLEGLSGPPSDLVDRAASETYLAGGEVFVVPGDEMPTATAMTAMLRW